MIKSHFIRGVNKISGVVNRFLYPSLFSYDIQRIPQNTIFDNSGFHWQQIKQSVLLTKYQQESTSLIIILVTYLVNKKSS